MFSAAMTEISEEFCSIAGIYKIVSLFVIGLCLGA